MAIAAFDTLATARKLKAAGVGDAQAEVIAAAVAANTGLTVALLKLLP